MLVFALTVVIFYQILYKKKTHSKVSPLSISLVYVIVSLHGHNRTVDNNAYLISVNELPYQFITNDDVFKLYKI
jgi:hypothetical protein